MSLRQINAGNRTAGYKNGFVLLGNDAEVVYYPVKASVTIAKGDLLGDDGAGFAQLETAFAANTLGVAAESIATQTSDGDVDVAIIPVANTNNRWIVPVEAVSAGTAIVATDRMLAVDIESEDGIDVTDTTIVGYGFLIEEIDISTASIAAVTMGHAIGRFVQQER